MKKDLSPEMHQLLGEYFKVFIKLKTSYYPGSIALIDDYENLEEGRERECDEFFSKYGVGNRYTDTGLDRPSERIRAYELLLYILLEYDPERFRKIHKGVPYYFIGWAAFHVGDYQKGLFYIESSVSEDLRKRGKSFDKKTSFEKPPSINFLLLGENVFVGFEAGLTLKTAVSREIESFSKNAGINLTAPLFIKEFVTEQFTNSSFRTIVTSLYSFIIEYQDRQLQIRVRSSEGRSIEPFLLHLFKGCLILESILKLKSSIKSTSLKSVTEGLEVKLEVDASLLKGGKTLQGAIDTMDSLAERQKPYQDICFATAYIVRNTTGHQLIWPDVFDDVFDLNTYQQLYQYVLGASLWSIYKLWIEPTDNKKSA